MRDLIVRYTSFISAQTQQLAACNVFHSLEKRMARWLLQLSDRIGGCDLLTTQDTISEILGVRRTSVTLVAHKLRREGVIHYSRGHITIRQPKALQALACECYETGRRAEALFGQHDLPLAPGASGAAR